MTRTTDQRSPRVDHQLGHEESALVEGAPDEGRAALAATFPPTAFPARPGRLAEVAAGAYADDLLVDALGQLPDREYASVDDLEPALRNHADARAIVTRANR